MNEFKVGLLAVATMIAIVVMSLKITSNQSGFGQYVTYRTIIKDSSDVLADVKQIVHSLKESISPEGEISPVKKILADAQEVVANTKEITATLKRVTNGNEQKINALIDNLEAFSEDIAYQVN